MISPAVRTEHRAAPWRHLFPSHRLPVLAKTPVLIALGAYLAGGHFQLRTVGATMVVAALLWVALYALNEAADLAIEQRLLVGRSVMPLLLGTTLAVSAASACLSPHLAVLLLLMTAGQCAYSLPPWRIKRWWWAVLLLSGI